MARRVSIAVIGAGKVSSEVAALAREVGRLIAERGAVMVCGGLGGVMAAAAQGARTAGGHTVGILPSYDLDSANDFIEFPIATGIGEARNALVVASADAVIALEGEAGTLSEIGLAMKIGRPVVALNSWPEIKGPGRAANAAEAVQRALELAASRRKKR
jgi:uncharacterized protein (TIGR00725 family)